MRNEAWIRVYYPVDREEIVLRCEGDWRKNVEPVAADRQQGWFDFRLPFQGDFVYWKALLLDGEQELWSQGNNELAFPARSRPLEVWPHFRDDAECSVCNLHEVGAEGHSVRVFYPPGYSENNLASYPVLYMQDGQNLFFPNEAFGGQHWKVEETLGVLTSMNLIRKAIVVGVYPRDRMREYTSPGYEKYGRFFVGELKPWIDRNYRTRSGAENNAVLGSSLGGVVSFYLGWEYPETFGQVGAMSSTFGFKDDLLERVASEPRRKSRIYLDTGWPHDNYEVNRALRRLLLKRGYVEGDDVLYLAFPEASHNEQAWAMRAHVPFQYFFGRSDGTGGAKSASARPRTRSRKAAPVRHSGPRAVRAGRDRLLVAR